MTWVARGRHLRKSSQHRRLTTSIHPRDEPPALGDPPPRVRRRDLRLAHPRIPVTANTTRTRPAGCRSKASISPSRGWNAAGSCGTSPSRPSPRQPAPRQPAARTSRLHDDVDLHPVIADQHALASRDIQARRTPRATSHRGTPPASPHGAGTTPESTSPPHTERVHGLTDSGRPKVELTRRPWQIRSVGRRQLPGPAPGDGFDVEVTVEPGQGGLVVRLTGSGPGRLSRAGHS